MHLTTSPNQRVLRDYAVRVVNPNQRPLEYTTRAPSACDAFEAATECLTENGGRVSVKTIPERTFP